MKNNATTTTTAHSAGIALNRVEGDNEDDGMTSNYIVTSAMRTTLANSKEQRQRRQQQQQQQQLQQCVKIKSIKRATTRATRESALKSQH